MKQMAEDVVQQTPGVTRVVNYRRYEMIGRFFHHAAHPYCGARTRMNLNEHAVEATIRVVLL
jgi:hypothetical protein